MKAILICSLFILCIHCSVSGQNGEESGLFLETDRINQTDSELNDVELAEQVCIDLNDTVECRETGFLVFTETELNMLRTHRNQFGKLLHVNELQLFLTPERIEAILPHVRVETQEASVATQSGRIESQLHWKSDQMLSNPTWRMRGKFSIASSEFVWSLEQDAGEAWRSWKAGGFDHLRIGARNRIRKGLDVYTGAYRVRFGEGLFTPNLFLNQKSSDAARIKAEGAAVRLNNSFDENSLMGIAVRQTGPHWTTIISLASARVDARPSEDQENFTGFLLSGSHVSESELKARDFVRRDQVLAHIEYMRGSMLLGLSSNTERFNKALLPEPRPDNHLYPKGRFYQDLGANFRATFGTRILFGEVKTNLNLETSALLGMIQSLGRSMDISVLSRSYHVANTSWNSSAFGRYADNRNERGCMVGYKWYISKYKMLDVVFDRYVRPRFIYPNPLNEGGGADLSICYKRKRKGRSENQLKLRLHTEYPNDALSGMRLSYSSARSISSSLQWTMRSQFARTENSASLFVQSELSCKSRKVQLLLLTAIQQQRGDFKAMYYFEKDLLYAFHVHVLSGNSARQMVLFDYLPAKGQRLRLKLWQTTEMYGTPDFGLKLQWIYGWN